MDYLALSQTALFEGIATQKIEHVLKCLGSRVKTYQKGASIFSIGDQTQEIGLVLSGTVLIENNDLWGNRTILAAIGKDYIFAESYAYVKEKLKVSVTAAEATEVLFLNAQSIITMCAKACHFHTRLIQNLLAISSSNNIRLSERILNTSAKTIRGRLISYLSQEAYKNRSNEFAIPLSRQELADYLNVDRSALSNELGKMRDEKIVSFHKNKFHLLTMAPPQ